MRRIAVIVVILVALATLGMLRVAQRDSTTAAGAGSAAGADTAAAARAAATPPAVTLQQLPHTFEQPVYVTAPPGDTDRLFVVEKTGRIVIVKDGALLAKPFLDISGKVTRGGEQGLLSMAFHPRYAANGRFFVDYTNLKGDTRVVRYRVSRTDPDVAIASSAKVVLRVRQPYANHNGGQLQFSPGGRLFVGMGDGGSGGDPQRRAQDSRSRLGKLLRLNVDVSPVKVGVYAKGLRNPWRFSFDRSTGALWIGDVGQSSREEIDYLKRGRPAGANFGWNAYEGTRVYDRAVARKLKKRSLTWPVAQYGRGAGVSVTGGYVYRGAAIPALRGFYLFADFGSGRVWAKKGPGGARSVLPGVDGQTSQVSSFGQDAASELYVVSLAGRVYRIVASP